MYIKCITGHFGFWDLRISISNQANSNAVTPNSVYLAVTALPAMRTLYLVIRNFTVRKKNLKFIAVLKEFFLAKYRIFFKCICLDVNSISFQSSQEDSLLRQPKAIFDPYMSNTYIHFYVLSGGT